MLVLDDLIPKHSIASHNDDIRISKIVNAMISANSMGLLYEGVHTVIVMRTRIQLNTMTFSKFLCVKRESQSKY